jgi:hypothetical protein
MRYTHASSPDELSLEPLFPLPTEAFEDQFLTFGQFTDRELQMISRMNSSPTPSDKPLDHLLDLHEVPLMADMERLAIEYGTAPSQDVRAYRAGICLGFSVLRKHTAHTFAEKDSWPSLTPGRQYLRVPEWLDTERADVYSRFGHEYKPERTKYYVDKMSTERYVVDGEALSRAAISMGEYWENMADSVLSNQRRYWGKDLFGYACEGFADSLRLRRILEYEQRVAPATQTVFDPEVHFAIDDATPTGRELAKQAASISRVLQHQPDNEDLLRARYPVEGVTACNLAVAYDGEAFSAPHRTAPRTTWGGTRVGFGDTITCIRQAIGGFATTEAGSTDVIPVGFRKSEEQFTPETEDILVMNGLGFGLLRAPFVVDEPRASVAALSERGSAAFLSTANALYSDPDLNVHDGGFMYVLQRALAETGDEHQKHILRSFRPD